MRRVKFSDIATFKYGTIISDFCEQGYPVFSGYTITGYTDKYMYEEEKLVVICRGKGGTGDVKIAPAKSWITNLSIICELDEKVVDYRYLYYYLLLNNERMRKLDTGSCQSQITVEQLGWFLIDLPELDVQKKVADCLIEIDTTIEINKKVELECREYAKKIFTHWFLQYDYPVGGLPYRTSGGVMRYDEKLKREVPIGWKTMRCGDLFATNRGVSYSTPDIETGEGVPMINLATFGVDGQYKADGIKYYSGNYSSDKLLQPYDLVMCNTQQTAIDYGKDIIGKAIIVPDIFGTEDIVSSHHVNVIKTYKAEMKYYLYHLFNSDFWHKYIAGFANGTNILGLVFEGVTEYYTEVPDDETLRKFAELMQDIEEKKSLILKENMELVKLRDFLLPLLINGQVVFQD